MASTSIKVTNNYSDAVDIQIEWLLPIFVIGLQRIARGQTAVFPCEWVWYNVRLNPNNGVGGFSLQQWVYGGSSISVPP